MLQAAHQLFAERGFGDVTMDDVAEAVGVTKPLLYNYFGNKEQLYLAVMEPAGEALVKSIADAVALTDTPAAALEAGMHAFFSFLASDRDAWRVLFDETVPASGLVAQRVAQHRDRLTELVATALLAQVPARGRAGARTEIEALSIAVLAAAEATGRWWLRTDAVTPERAAQLLIETIGPGLARHTAARKPARKAPKAA